MVSGMDMFPERVPQFKLGGEDSVQTLAGGTISIIVMIVSTMFAILKLEQMITVSTPSINEFVLTNEYTSEDKLNLGHGGDDFMMAFGLVDSQWKPFNNPRFVKWLAMYYTAENYG